MYITLPWVTEPDPWLPRKIDSEVCNIPCLDMPHDLSTLKRAAGKYNGTVQE